MPEKNEGPLVYADTNVWIASLQAEPGHDIPDGLFGAAARGEVRLIASWLLRAELSKPPAGSVDEGVVEMVEEILDNEQITWVELDRFVALQSLDLARRFGLSGADAVHLGTAVRNEADFFMAYDRKFPYGKTIGKTRVVKPCVVWPSNLFDPPD